MMPTSATWKSSKKCFRKRRYITTRTADVLIIGHLLFERIYIIIAILHYFSRLFVAKLVKNIESAKFKWSRAS